jgi:hypothetical protein
VRIVQQHGAAGQLARLPDHRLRTPNTFTNFLQSDVVTIIKVTRGSDVTYSPTVYADNGQVRLRMALKDIGTPASPTAPTTNNQITVTQYHVTFKRADGRNTPGVDVPYGFDGVVTGTIDATGSTLSFELVRAQSKFDPPLLALRSGGGAMLISTIAEIVFYGHDQAGHQVSVTGMISVDFADWADPQ